MPRFPDYVAQVSPAPGNAPRIDIGAEAVSSGLAQFGRGVSAFGEDVARRQALAEAVSARETAQNRFDDDEKLRAAQRRMTAENDAALAGYGENPRGFHDTALARSRTLEANALRSITPGNRDAARIALRDQQMLESDRTSRIELEGRASYERTGFLSTVADLAAAVARTPEAIAGAGASLAARLDTMVSLSPQDREKLARDAEQKLATVHWQASYGSDPADGKAALGLAATPNPAAASGGDAPADEAYYVALAR